MYVGFNLRQEISRGRDETIGGSEFDASSSSRYFLTLERAGKGRS